MLVVDTAKTRPPNVSKPSSQRALPFGNFGLLNCGVRHARIFYCPHLGARTSEMALALLGSRYERGTEYSASSGREVALHVQKY